MTKTRSNLAFAINKLNQFYYNLIVRYANIINKVFKYLIKTIELDL